MCPSNIYNNMRGLSVVIQTQDSARFLGILIFLIILISPSLVNGTSIGIYSLQKDNAGFTNDLQFSTYFGGTGWDTVEELVIDAQGNIYIAGYTESTDFPTTKGAYDRFHNGGSFDLAPIDAFVMKLSRDGQEIIYSTFLGGSGDDYIYDLVVDAQGCAYVTGKTDSSNFPTINGYDDSYNSGEDCFVAKLSSNGSELLFSTYIGGSGDDVAFCIALDSEKNCVVAGRTSSPNFPVLTSNLGYQYNSLGHNFDGFVLKLSNTGKSIQYSMYLGGSDSDEWAEGITLDLEDNAIIVGGTSSPDFPTVNAYDDTLSGPSDCFITKVGADGQTIFSTFYGGSDVDFAYAVSSSDTGKLCIAGATYGGVFPLIGLQNDIFNSSRGITLLIMDSEGTEVFFSGVLRNSADEDHSSRVLNLIMKSEHEIWLSGSTDYGVFPITDDAFDNICLGEEGYIALFDPISCSLNYVSFFGGREDDAIRGFAIDESGNIIGAGWTFSSDLHVNNALHDEKIGSAGDQDGFVFRLTLTDTNLVLAFGILLTGSVIIVLALIIVIKTRTK